MIAGSVFAALGVNATYAEASEWYNTLTGEPLRPTDAPSKLVEVSWYGGTVEVLYVYTVPIPIQAVRNEQVMDWLNMIKNGRTADHTYTILESFDGRTVHEGDFEQNIAVEQNQAIDSSINDSCNTIGN
jgi:hypothetical protein